MGNLGRHFNDWLNVIFFFAVSGVIAWICLIVKFVLVLCGR